MPIRAYAREHVELAYATTTHCVQGDTVAVAQVAIGTDTSAELGSSGCTVREHVIHDNGSRLEAQTNPDGSDHEGDRRAVTVSKVNLIRVAADESPITCGSHPRERRDASVRRSLLVGPRGARLRSSSSAEEPVREVMERHDHVGVVARPRPAEHVAGR